MKGVDVSHYQKDLTIRQIKAVGCDFAIIKVTEGAWIVDAAAFDFYREAYEMGFPVGCYCYSHATTTEEARSEAQFLLNTINKFPMPCGVFLDIEEPKQLGLSKKKLIEIVEAWCGAIRAEGYTPGIYGSEGTIWAKLGPSQPGSDALVWVAHYGKQPDVPCDLWQSSDSGNIGGVTVDTDEVRSDRLKALVKRGFVSSKLAASTASPEGKASIISGISETLNMLARYLRTDEFIREFSDYIQRSEVPE